MGLCIRVFILISLMIFTACAVCSSLFPQFRAKKSHDADFMPLFSLKGVNYSATNVKVDYWHITGGMPELALLVLRQTATVSNVTHFPTKLVVPTYEAYKGCSSLRTYFTASGALAIAGAALGGISTLLAASHLCTSANCCLACSVLVLCLFAFACMAVPFALMIVVYMKDTCKGYHKLKDSANLVEGFALSVAACGGFLITAFFELCA